MDYQNRLPPEGINTSQVHPLKHFLQLLVTAFVLVIVLVVLLQVSGSYLAKRIPFAFEQSVMQTLDVPLGNDTDHPNATRYLNALAQDLLQHMVVPDAIEIVVHYDNSDVFNAFATVGGNLLFFKGLLELMPDENTLAMVMAHEIAHVVHRDPIASLGGGVASTVGALALTGPTGAGMAGSVLDSAGVLTSIQFTRRMENQADIAAFQALVSRYGHVGGAADLFSLFSEERGGVQGSILNTPNWLERFTSTHPLDDDRIRQSVQFAIDHSLQADGQRTPLPTAFRSWL